MKKRLMTTVAATFMALVASTLIPAAASFGKEVFGDPISDQVAQYEDALTVANDAGGSVDVEASRISNGLAFSEAMDTISNSFPDDFSEASFAGDRPWVGFRDSVPSEARKSIEALTFPVEVREGLGMSRAERESLERALAEKILELSSEDKCVEPSIVTVTPSAGTAVIETSCGAISSASFDQLNARISGAPVEIVVSFTPDQLVSDEILSGGTYLSRPNGTLGCTAGFTVRNVREGTTGLSTASHCDDNLSYESRNILTMAGSADGNSLDIQWYRSSEAARPAFVYNRSGAVQDVRFATGTTSPYAGLTVCKYGQSTYRGCSTVYSGPHIVVGGAAFYDSIWTSATYMTGPGDSGGPWYSGNTAVGIHKGSMVRDGSTRSIFTNIKFMESRTDLRVMTQ